MHVHDIPGTVRHNLGSCIKGLSFGLFALDSLRLLMRRKARLAAILDTGLEAGRQPQPQQPRAGGEFQQLHVSSPRGWLGPRTTQSQVQCRNLLPRWWEINIGPVNSSKGPCASVLRFACSRLSEKRPVNIVLRTEDADMSFTFINKSSCGRLPAVWRARSCDQPVRRMRVCLSCARVWAS
ncbi:uncharacterized protein BP01DRAFT_199550 [Aspergillus saccharolyticus JOP 1030-1]|uniref:Uncharacterized protein n=1 Tax=Aspergillus saccharolyticus JOP 1030-1 TaxID=1450539 RepID=A0A318ZJZ5_9EURO|nr:hypothetical protein BP01DRAFT_199550 [Aspergillus saccharolyticus JOP 1030-1]PYH47869.1 hypothetical protein BP01DRAFT_199550 [Aspergillus saccharolyticus JOP 1030-1]